MKEVVKLLGEYEVRNNVDVMLILQPDGSSGLYQVVDNEPISLFDTSEELELFLKN